MHTAYHKLVIIVMYRIDLSPQGVILGLASMVSCSDVTTIKKSSFSELSISFELKTCSELSEWTLNHICFLSDWF